MLDILEIIYSTTEEGKIIMPTRIPYRLSKFHQQNLLLFISV